MSNYKTNLQLNNEALNSNNLDLQSLIDQANALPDAGGIDLPELTNEGSASDLMLNKELIDSNGNKVTGTFTIDSELSEQDDLIAQIASALEGKAVGGSGGNLELYDLVIEQTEGIYITTISYLAYSNGIFEYHGDSINDSSPSITFSNVVLKTPVQFGFSTNGQSDLISNIECVYPYDYPMNIDSSPHYISDFVPLTTQDGKIIIRLSED
jgi:hypothetical protein